MLNQRMLKRISKYNEGLSINKNYTISNTNYSIFNNNCHPSIIKYYSNETTFYKLINNPRFDRGVSLLTLASNGCLDMIKLASKYNMKMTFLMLYLATFYGHFNVVKYIIKSNINLIKSDPYKIIRTAKFCNHTNILNYLEEIHCI